MHLETSELKWLSVRAGAEHDLGVVRQRCYCIADVANMQTPETGGEIVPESGGAIISEQRGGFIGIGNHDPGKHKTGLTKPPN